MDTSLMVIDPNQAITVEIWRPIPDYEDVYEVSSLGRIRRIAGGRSTRSGRILRGFFIRDGYKRVCLSKNGKMAQFLIHRLVATVFVCKPPAPDYEVNHINSDRVDNRAENLEWVTHTENIRHSFDYGHNTRQGEKNSHAVLSWDLVKEIRSLYSLGTPQPELAKTYGVQRSCISKIITGRTWKEQEN